jgi:membrane protein DedA with SNARE-associated domain
MELSVLSQFVAWASSISGVLGYPGIFLINLIGSASVIFPVPSFIVTFTFGAILNPWLVGVSAGIGAAIGELVGYVLGRGGKKLVEGKHEKTLRKSREWMERHGAFSIIVLFALTPLPDDVIGILCGMINYDVRKFLLASLIGKVVMSLFLAWGGFFGVGWILSVFGG